MPPVVDYEEEKVKNEMMVKEYRAKQPPRDEFQGGFVPGGHPGRKEPPSTGVAVVSQPAPPKFQTILVERFRNKLRERGGRGMIGLRRQFKIMDDNGSGALDHYEFKKGIKDF